MNGRVYDADLGRMQSADPFVQFPTFSQSFNRYSYVLNNSLSFTDPSGNFALGTSTTSGSTQQNSVGNAGTSSGNFLGTSITSSTTQHNSVGNAGISGGNFLTTSPRNDLPIVGDPNDRTVIIPGSPFQNSLGNVGMSGDNFLTTSIPNSSRKQFVGNSIKSDCFLCTLDRVVTFVDSGAWIRSDGSILINSQWSHIDYQTSDGRRIKVLAPAGTWADGILANSEWSRAGGSILANSEWSRVDYQTSDGRRIKVLAPAGTWADGVLANSEWSHAEGSILTNSQWPRVDYQTSDGRIVKVLATP